MCKVYCEARKTVHINNEPNSELAAGEKLTILLSSIPVFKLPSSQQDPTHLVDKVWVKRHPGNTGALVRLCH